MVIKPRLSSVSDRPLMCVCPRVLRPHPHLLLRPLLPRSRSASPHHLHSSTAPPPHRRRALSRSPPLLPPPSGAPLRPSPRISSPPPATPPSMRSTHGLAATHPAAGFGDKDNICQHRDGVSDCPTLRQVGVVSTKRKKKPGGFNLRKSIAWNPAFFTEEGVLDNVELSMLSGSQLKANGSPSSGLGATISPSCRFGKSGNSSVLKEVAENSRVKFPAKFRTTENKGRKFSFAKTFERDEREEPAGTQDKRSARRIQKCIPRPPAGYTPKKVPNSSATAQVSRTPKKSQPSLPMVSRSTSSVTNISKSNIKLAPGAYCYCHL